MLVPAFAIFLFSTAPTNVGAFSLVPLPTLPSKHVWRKSPASFATRRPLFLAERPYDDGSFEDGSSIRTDEKIAFDQFSVDDHTNEASTTFFSSMEMKDSRMISSSPPMGIPSIAAVATVVATGMTTIFSLPMAADAATTTAGVIPSALWAYAHYFSIILVTAILVAERFIIKPGMTVDDEETLVKLDVLYGITALLLIGAGYERAVNFGKGGDFYIHEITFWIKMALAGVWGGLSLFPTFTFVKRKVARTVGNAEDVPPVSEKLVARLQQVVNAEITAMLSIPLLATLMARGVGFNEGLPWQAGAGFALTVTGGAFFFYGKQALTWEE